jgi:hypothetical protein
MSSFLYLEISAPATVSIVESELLSFVVERCADRVLNNALQQYRFNVTTESNGVLVEPFISGAAFQALMRNKKKRPMLQVFLDAMCEWANQRDFDAGLLVVTSRPRRPVRRKRYVSVEAYFEAIDS